ncbi:MULTISPECIES: nucleotide pyrophosphohydrolase [unclassified Crossiella]|uniref:nucleotide pyrophosphohydrolase n=1 Tax=unclassified Crossiella TaxID=2620835 RepID=UPI001FFFB092|nr:MULTISPECIES: nucleotide pyrophosphohydrolase [unclassified Crossiella]MCK2237594.1 nucleotide pyrophosphohydrolase [Crossiella sp. S99.2]MCK2254880.1 nucleotide pyrophosphohydrolase [Crossiella sp. S99.1]
MEISELQAMVAQFVAERDWDRFHTPKNLAMALVGEVGELAEIFQWLTEDEAWQVMSREEQAERVRHELADVLSYLLRLATVLDVDLVAAMREKGAVNAARYPVELVKGRSELTKYTRLPGVSPGPAAQD